MTAKSFSNPGPVVHPNDRRLTDEQVIRLRSRKDTLMSLSLAWGFSEGTLWRARAGLSYRHLPMPGEDVQKAEISTETQPEGE